MYKVFYLILILFFSLFMSFCGLSKSIKTEKKQEKEAPEATLSNQDLLNDLLKLDQKNKQENEIMKDDAVSIRDTEDQGEAVKDQKDPDKKEYLEENETKFSTKKQQKTITAARIEGITFRFDSSELQLNEYGDILQQMSDDIRNLNASDVLVEGHTDQIGTREYNMELGQKRAESVAKYIKNKTNFKAKTVSYGKEKPVKSIEPLQKKIIKIKTMKNQEDRKKALAKIKKEIREINSINRRAVVEIKFSEDE